MRPDSIRPENVKQVLNRHMLADGFDVIVDLRKSQGSWLVDHRDGRRYVDFFTGVASMPLGYNHPKMMNDDVIRHLGEVALNKPSNSDLYSVEMAEFVDTFHRLAVPPYLKYSFFVEGGSVAVENAVKAAFDWKVQKNLARGYTKDRGYGEGRGHQVIHFREAFHGRTGYSLSMTNTDPTKIRWYPKFHWPRVSNPKASFPLAGENLMRTIAAEERSVREIVEAVDKNRDDIAALILEPIQGEGGDNHFRAEFFQTLRRLADEHEFLLIMDEVQTGVGLTGQWWAHQNYGIQPDLVVFGKKMQVCGILGGPRLDEIPENVFRVSSRINSTWGGNLVDMVRARLYLEIIAEEKLIEHARTQGERLLAGLSELAAETKGKISNVRGAGLFCACDLPDAATRKALLEATWAEGVMMLPSGEHSLRFRPALNIPPDVLDQGLSLFAKAARRILT